MLFSVYYKIKWYNPYLVVFTSLLQIENRIRECPAGSWWHSVTEHSFNFSVYEAFPTKLNLVKQKNYFYFSLSCVFYAGYQLKGHGGSA